MANVSFKRGLATNLFKTGVTYEDGCFYLTTDTNRLYIGKTIDNQIKCVPVNQGVISVANLDAITKAADIDKTPGLFYYAESENILCTYNGTKWVQINPDTDTNTKLTAIETTATKDANADIVTIKHTLSNTTYDAGGK